MPPHINDTSIITSNSVHDDDHVTIMDVLSTTSSTTSASNNNNNNNISSKGKQENSSSYDHCKKKKKKTKKDRRHILFLGASDASGYGIGQSFPSIIERLAKENGFHWKISNPTSRPGRSTKDGINMLPYYPKSLVTTTEKTTTTEITTTPGIDSVFITLGIEMSFIMLIF